jgi:hypothetical protein
LYKLPRASKKGGARITETEVPHGGLLASARPDRMVVNRTVLR